jgi:hypothetical protein
MDACDGVVGIGPAPPPGASISHTAAVAVAAHARREYLPGDDRGEKRPRAQRTRSQYGGQYRWEATKREAGMMQVTDIGALSPELGSWAVPTLQLLLGSSSGVVYI